MTVELADDSAESRKARGAFFTPAVVADFLADWAIRAASDHVLEPSCGDGAILHAVVERLRELGDPSPIRGFELHEESAAAARQVLVDLRHDGTIEVGDFLATTAKPEFDAVVGNPPYIRYQGFTGEARSRGLAAALAQGVRLSKLSSSWASFVIHAAGYLAPEGRLALVLPAELLTSNYAQEVRDFLLRRFASVSVVLFGRHVFPGVQTEALLLLAEGTGGCDGVRFSTVDEVGHLQTVAFDTVIDFGRGERWTTALVSLEAQLHLHQLAAARAFVPLSTWGRLSLGAVTGNNRYFIISPERARELGLASTDVVPVSPAGSSHLRALTLTKRTHGSLGRDGAGTLLFRPEEPSAAALAYIAQGEAMGVQDAYKCRVRTPWWRTPLPAPPHLFFTYMNEATPQLAANPARLHYVNSVHGLYLHEDDADLAEVLALAALNSATALSAEISGRAYGGGILKMEPREAAKLLVPSPASVRHRRADLEDALPAAKRLLGAGHLPAARELIDGILFAGGALGSGGLGAIRGAHRRLSERRRVRARSRTSTKGTA